MKKKFKHGIYTYCQKKKPKSDTVLTVALIITTVAIFYALDLDASTLPMVGLGLDQWLYKKNYVKNWDHDKEKAIINLAGEKTVGIKPERIAYITEEIFYWRKANQIHAFFMADQEDHCQDIHVTPLKLQDLHALCTQIINECPLVDGVVGNGKSFKDGEWVQNTELGKILSNQELAHKLLPTQEGFFFGNTEYNQYYMEDIVATKEMLDELFKQPKWNHADYTYSPSW